jgi:lipid II:glycine glycyltransferase (peptidoglycan interpeptide bridge formation enzyme)
VKIIDPTADSRWDGFVASQENGTVFHSSAWARVIKDTYGYLSRTYIVENEDGQVRAAIPFYFIRCKLTGKRLVCLPFSDYCWPLSRNKADIESLLRAVKNEMDTGNCPAKYLEIRGWQNKAPEVPVSLAVDNYYISYLLEIEPDPDALNARFHHSVRRGIHQAEKRDVTVRLTNSEKDMEQFYRLNLATRKKLGVFPQPRAFFNNLYRHIISRNLGFLGIAEYGGKTIAGVVFLTYGDTIYYKYNASDEKYLQKRPNHMIIWEAIKYACAHNYRHFDFGRCTPEEEGLRNFKARWGAKEIALPYYYYPGKTGVNIFAENSVRFRTMRLFSNMTPRFLFAAVGSALYKHFG